MGHVNFWHLSGGVDYLVIVGKNDLWFRQKNCNALKRFFCIFWLIKFYLIQTRIFYFDFLCIPMLKQTDRYVKMSHKFCFVYQTHLVNKWLHLWSCAYKRRWMYSMNQENCRYFDENLLHLHSVRNYQKTFHERIFLRKRTKQVAEKTFF